MVAIQKRQSLQWLVGSLTAHSARERRSSPFLGLEPAASLHSSLAAIGALVDVGGRPHLSPRLLPFVSVTHLTWITAHLPTPEGWKAELAMLLTGSGRTA